MRRKVRDSARFKRVFPSFLRRFFRFFSAFRFGVGGSRRGVGFFPGGLRLGFLRLGDFGVERLDLRLDFGGTARAVELFEKRGVLGPLRFELFNFRFRRFDRRVDHRFLRLDHSSVRRRPLRLQRLQTFGFRIIHMRARAPGAHPAGSYRRAVPGRFRVGSFLLRRDLGVEPLDVRFFLRVRLGAELFAEPELRRVRRVFDFDARRFRPFAQLFERVRRRVDVLRRVRRTRLPSRPSRDARERGPADDRQRVPRRRLQERLRDGRFFGRFLKVAPKFQNRLSGLEPLREILDARRDRRNGPRRRRRLAVERRQDRPDLRKPLRGAAESLDQPVEKVGRERAFELAGRVGRFLCGDDDFAEPVANVPRLVLEKAERLLNFRQAVDEAAVRVADVSEFVNPFPRRDLRLVQAGNALAERVNKEPLRVDRYAERLRPTRDFRRRRLDRVRNFRPRIDACESRPRRRVDRRFLRPRRVDDRFRLLRRRLDGFGARRDFPLGAFFGDFAKLFKRRDGRVLLRFDGGGVARTRLGDRFKRRRLRRGVFLRRSR